MTVYASEIGPNNCTTISISDRDILVVSDGQTEVNVGDDGCYIHQQADNQTVGLYEVDGAAGGYNTIATATGDDGEWFAGFEVDWVNGQTSQGNFSDTKLVVGADTGNYAFPVFSSGDAYDVLEGDTSHLERRLESSIQDDLDAQYCRGGEDSFTVRVENQSICRSINASVEITNLLTGDSTTVNATNSFTETSDLKRLNQRYIEHTFTIPDDTPLGQQDIFTVEVKATNAINELPTYTLSSFIGSRPENLSLQSIDDVSGVCGGERVSPEIVAINESSCPANLGVEIVNDQTDGVVTAGPTSVSTGEAEPGTNSYFVNFNLPDVPSSVDEVNYSANLTMADETVDTETFTVEVSQPDISIGVFEAPGQACSGDEIRMSIEGKNDGGCDGSARALVTNNINDDVIESSSSSLRAGSSRSIRLEDTIPPDASSEGAITYTATLVDSSGNQVAEETATINIGSVDISLQNLEFPNSVCAGQEVSGEIEATNNGECPTDVTVAITQESTGETDRLGTVSLRDGSSRTIRFEQQIPFDTIELEQDTFTLASQVAGPDGNVITDTLETTASIDSTDVQLVGISSPSSACVGSEVNSTFNIANEGGCDGEYRVLVTDSVSQNEQVVDNAEIRSQRRDTAVLEDTMHPAAVSQGGIVYSYEIQSLIAGNFQTVEEGEFTVNADTANLEFGSVDIPEQQCIGTSVSFKIPLENTGECDTGYRISLNNVTKGENNVVAEGNINSGDSTTARFDDELTSSLVTEDAVTYDINLQRRLNQNSEWETAKDIQTSVTVLKPNVTVSSTNYPEFTSPGDKQYEVEISNDSSCNTNVDVDISGETTNLDISSQSSLTITDSFTLTADENVRDITVTDNILEQDVDEAEETIQPHKFINVNQSEGVLEIKGGYDEEAIYSGNLLATAVSEGNNLEEEDSVFGALGANTIQGTSTTNSADKDAIRFAALKGINIQISETASIVVDGEVRGTSKSYRHSTAASSLARFDGDSQAQIKTISGPVSNLGAVRRRFDVGTGVLSGPVFTINR